MPLINVAGESMHIRQILRSPTRMLQTITILVMSAIYPLLISKLHKKRCTKKHDLETKQTNKQSSASVKLSLLKIFAL